MDLVFSFYSIFPFILGFYSNSKADEFSEYLAYTQWSSPSSIKSITSITSISGVKVCLGCPEGTKFINLIYNYLGYYNDNKDSGVESCKVCPNNSYPDLGTCDLYSKSRSYQHTRVIINNYVVESGSTKCLPCSEGILI